MRSFGPIELSVDSHGVAEVVFTDAARGNPIDAEFCRGFEALSVELAAAPAVRCVYLRAEGPAFSVGGDLRLFAAHDGPLATLVQRMMASLNAGISRLQRLDAPLVAAVHGACAGGMVAIVAGCDVLVAAADARFVAAYPRIGFSCDAGASVTLPQRMGRARARRYLLLGETIDAPAALVAGLADEVVPVDSARRHARALADRLALGPTRAYGEMRRLLLDGAGMSLEERLDLEAAALSRCVASDDAKEGIAAFVAKRPPVFRGR